MTDDALLALCLRLAGEAGAAILAVRRGGFEVARKADASPVTLADTAAEAIIVAGLREAAPGIPVIAEEEVAAGRHTDPGPAFWLVDPLDGTREFAAGRDDFTVNIGLVRQGRAVLGVVGVPARGETFAGILGRGAWKRRDGEPLAPIHARRPPAAGLAVMASHHYRDDPRLPEFLNGPFLAGRPVASVTHIGSALKLCRLAEGAADLYPRLGTTMEWDTAGPQAVLEAAGGALVRHDDATPLGYGKPGFKNPWFVATGVA